MKQWNGQMTRCPPPKITCHPVHVYTLVAHRLTYLCCGSVWNNYCSEETLNSICCMKNPLDGFHHFSLLDWNFEYVWSHKIRQFCWAERVGERHKEKWERKQILLIHNLNIENYFSACEHTTPHILLKHFSYF